MTQTIIRKVESVLFGAGKRISLEHISKLCKVTEEEAKEALISLKQEYEEKDTSLRVTHDGDFWKLTVRDAFATTVEKLVTQAEFSKTVMETLAVIAYKAPVLQSDVIRIRTNKAYDHIFLLEDEGFITRQKQGRTKLIRLSPKFYDYFDLPEDALKARFAPVRQKETEVNDYEQQRKVLIEEIKKRKEELVAADEESRKEHEARIKQLSEEISEIEKLETYDVKETYDDESPTQLEIVKDQVGGLDVYETESKEGTHWGDFDVYTPKPKVSEKGEEDEEEYESEETGEGEEVSEGEIDKEEDVGKGEELPGASEDVGKITTKSEGEPKKPRDVLEDVEIKEGAEPEQVEIDQLERKEGKGMFAEGIPDDIQKKIDKKIDDLLHPVEESEDESREEDKKDSKSKERTDVKEAADVKKEAAEVKSKEVKEENLDAAPEDVKEEKKPEPKKEQPQKPEEGQDILSQPMHVKDEDTD